MSMRSICHSIFYTYIELNVRQVSFIDISSIIYLDWVFIERVGIEMHIEMHIEK